MGGLLDGGMAECVDGWVICENNDLNLSQSMNKSQTNFKAKKTNKISFKKTFNTMAF